MTHLYQCCFRVCDIGQLPSDCRWVNMEGSQDDVAWLTQELDTVPSSQLSYWRHPETVPMVRYVYDDEEYVETNPHEVVIRQ